MGAALHLAHINQPAQPKRKGGGGGGGDGYDRLVARVYRDTRMTPQSRELILLLAWLVARDPDRLHPDGTPSAPKTVWNRAVDILGEYPMGRRKGSRLADLIHADRPRYEPDRSGPEWHATCRAPMIRRDGECGQPPVDHSRTVDPVTGWWTPVPYCRRHEGWGRKLDAALEAAGPVEPIPNAGGLMPSYLRANDGDEGWVSVYRRACEWHRTPWEPSARYGLCADDWPVPGRDAAIGHPRLRLVLGGAGLNLGPGGVS